MPRKLFAFDLDGTLLDSHKRISDANAEALGEMARLGHIVCLASGRLISSVRQYTSPRFDPAYITLNGAAVYTRESEGRSLISSTRLPAQYADHLIDYAQDKDFVLNYYIDDRLYAVKNQKTAPWIDYYYQQTRTPYEFLDTLEGFRGAHPFKTIMVGDDAYLDEEERHFRKKWDADSVYIVRTCPYYLEFLNPDGNKARGLSALAQAYEIPHTQVYAFGDADNDTPLLTRAGVGIAMRNATETTKNAADRVSPWTNDEDGVAREWERIMASETTTS